jgi:hypothetical protein
MTSALLTATTTSSGLGGSGLLLLAVLGFLAWRLALIALFPFAPHKPCKGSGKRWAHGNFRPRGCKGAGRRLRLGRRVWNRTSSTTTR